jgi:hypothetical protein
MAAALNACGYDEGLERARRCASGSATRSTRRWPRARTPATSATSLCLYIAQHRMTGTERDIAQYISLALYLTPPPELETSADLTEMPPDSTQVAEIVPLLRTLWPPWTCTASGWRCTASTTKRPTGCTIRCRR